MAEQTALEKLEGLLSTAVNEDGKCSDKVLYWDEVKPIVEQAVKDEKAKALEVMERLEKRLDERLGLYPGKDANEKDYRGTLASWSEITDAIKSYREGK